MKCFSARYPLKALRGASFNIDEELAVLMCMLCPFGTRINALLSGQILRFLLLLVMVPALLIIVFSIQECPSYITNFPAFLVTPHN